MVGEEGEGANFKLAGGGPLWSSPVGETLQEKLLKNCIFMAKYL